MRMYFLLFYPFRFGSRYLARSLSLSSSKFGGHPTTAPIPSERNGLELNLYLQSNRNIFQLRAIVFHTTLQFILPQTHILATGNQSKGRPPTKYTPQRSRIVLLL